MRYLENLNDTSVIKHGDSSETLRLSARNDNEPVTWSDGDAATIHVNQVGKQVPAKLVVGSNNVLVDSADLSDLAAGKYGLELWVTLKSGKTAIWPSDGSLEMTIDKNSDEITGDTVTTITLEDLEKRVDSKIAEGLKNIKIDPSQIPSVDLSGYAKKSDVPQVVYDKTAHTLTVNGVAVDIPAEVDLSGYAKLSDLPHVDLTPYLTKTDADSKYAIKADVPSVKYDKDARTLTVNGQQVSLPASVDLSNYALKSSIPAVSLDLTKRTLTLNGATISIPQQVDLSKYALSSQVPSVTYSHDTNTLTVDGVAVKIPGDVDLTPYAKSADVTKEIDEKIGSIPAVDLTGYVKKTDLADYARKTDIKPVPEIKLDAAKRTLTIAGQNIDIPAAVDLSQYARVDAVPSVALDTEKRTITVNGKSIDVPVNVDLSGYVTKSEMSAEIGKVASGGKIDLTGYVTKSDADATYETKADAAKYIPRSIANNIFAKKADLPKVTYDTTTREMKFTQNGVDPVIVTIPDEVDLSPYLKATTADATYAKKSDIPSSVDLTPYLKTADADTKYAAKSDLSDYAKKTDLSNYVDTNTFNENVAGIAGEIPQITYDSAKHTLNVNGTTVAIPQSVDMTPYMKTADAEQEFAKKSDVPSVVYDDSKKTLAVNGQAVEIPADVDLSGYAKLSDLPKVDLTPYLKATDADAKYATKDITPSIVPDNANNGWYLVTARTEHSSSTFTIPEISYNSGTLNIGNDSIYLGNLKNFITASDLRGYATTEWVNDKFNEQSSRKLRMTKNFRNKSIHVDFPNGDDAEIPNIDYTSDMKTLYIGTATFHFPDSVAYDADSKTLTVGNQTIDLSGSGSAIWFKSDAVDTSITWTYSGHTGYQTPINSLTGKNGDAATKVKPGDVVIDGTGKAFTVYGSTSDGKAELIAIGSTAGKGVQTKNISDWNAYQGGLGTAPMQYYGKQSIKQALQLDNSKTYTMDLDAGTLVNETDKVTQKLLPGIYQLRDLSTDVSNLTVKSDSNFGGNGGTPVQATITPYEIDVVLVNGADVNKAWRSAWLADQSSWYGVTDKWHIEK